MWRADAAESAAGGPSGQKPSGAEERRRMISGGAMVEEGRCGDASPLEWGEGDAWGSFAGKDFSPLYPYNLIAL